MSKISMPNLTNDYCPQTLFLYGTYGDDGKPDFGQFCWFSYYWDGDVHVMAAIGGEKLTLERIRKDKIFSANLVTEKVLPMADYLGCTNGRDPEKMNAPIAIEKGRKLNVPILTDCPVAFELEAEKITEYDEGTLILCKIHNVLMDEELQDARTPAEKLNAIRPMRYTCNTYFGWDGSDFGVAGTPGVDFKK